jgi:ankyrin repeat protein
MTDADKSLWRAILTDDADDVRRAIEDGADKEAGVGDLRLNALVTMSSEIAKRHPEWTSEEQAEIWQYLLKNLGQPSENQQKADVEDTHTPLLAALHYDFSKAAMALIAAGANPNQAAVSGLTPLLIAVRKGDIEAARSLLEVGANPNQAMPASDRCAQGHSPLVRAAGDGNLTLVRLLLKHGAEVNQRDGAGRTALLTACARPQGFGWKDLRERMEPASEKEAFPMVPLPRLMEGVGFPQEEEPAGEWDAIIDLLLEHGADVEAATELAQDHAIFLELAGTPLQRAALRGDASLMFRLLAAGATLRAVGGALPLHLAVQFGRDPETIRLLLKAGASATERDGEGTSPIGCAVAAGNLEGMKLLREAGADLFTRNPEFGTTLLHQAAQSGHLEIARYLLDSGLEVDAPCSAPSARERREQQERSRAEARKRFPNSDIDMPIHLLQPDGAPSAERPTGITPLMLAARANKAAMVQLLRERGADPKRRDSLGRSPRDYALATRDVEERQRAFLTASQSNIMEMPEMKNMLEQLKDLPGESHLANLKQQLEESQHNFQAMFDRFLGDKRTACEETLALLPE